MAEKMINLKRKSESITMATPEKEPKSRGVMVYMHDSPKIPIEEGDLKKIMKAEIEFIPREVGSRSVNGQKSQSYELEITGIKIMKG